MRILSFFLIGLILCPVVSAGTLIFTTTSANDIIFVALEENGTKLVLKTTAEIQAQGPVGVTYLNQRSTGELDAYFTLQKPSTGKPGLGRATTTFNGTSFSAITTIYYSPVLGSYLVLGGFRDQDNTYKIFRTRSTPKDDIFVFPTNASANPITAGKLYFHNPLGTAIRSAAVSPDGTLASISNSSIAEGSTNTFIFNEAGSPVETKKFHTSETIINTSLSDQNPFGDWIALNRELQAYSSGYQTSVYLMMCDGTSRLPRPAKRVAGPATLGGATSYDYQTIHYNTAAISENGAWIAYTLPGQGCGSSWETWARKTNRKGGFAGPAFRPFGACNVALGDGTVKFPNLRSFSLKTWNPPGQ